MKQVSVVLCTYNRANSLEAALESIVASAEASSLDWELVVVDNNSNDGTSALSNRWLRRYPRHIRYLFEATPGKSYALNTGVSAAVGTVIVFTDDDVLVERTWLQTIVQHLDEGSWAGAGGRILPVWRERPPEWLSPDDSGTLATLGLYDGGSDPSDLTEPPFGANMAFRREVFEKHGPFRTDLGPRPGSMIRGEDSEFGQRLLDRGERLRYHPDAVVYHPVPKDHLTESYFLGWWFDKGRSDVRVHGRSDRKRYSVFRVPIYLIRRLVLRAVLWGATFEPKRRFNRKRSVWYIAGQIAEHAASD